MALDFPANPTNGQVYDSYVYNSTVGAWQSREDSRTVAILSSTAPTSANPGDIWVNTNDGISFVYYDDGTSAQWMELLPSGVPLLSTKADLTYVDSQNALKANIASPTFTGVATAPRFTSTQATGTAPFTVSSTTVVANLNADLLDGQHASVYSPAGMVSQFAGAAAPTGWLLCDGTAISRTTYANLFAAIGTNYGTGDGSTTFNLPNLQGRVPVGKAASGTFASLNATGGVESTPLTVSHIPQHAHAIDHDHAAFNTASAGTHQHLFFMDDGAGIYGGATRYNTIQYDATSGATGNGGWFYTPGGNSAYDGTHAHSIDVPAFTGSSGNYGTATVTPVSALQPYIVMNYIIKV